MQLRWFLPFSSLNRRTFFKTVELQPIYSSTAQSIKGYLFVMPLLPHEIKSFILEDFKIMLLDVSKCAREMEINLLGLDGLIPTDLLNDTSFTTQLEVCVNNGTTLVAWSLFEAVYRLLRTRGRNLSDSKIAIYGAAKPAGNLCARKLAEYASKILLIDRDVETIESLRTTIQQTTASVEVETASQETLIQPDADIILLIGEHADACLDFNALKPDTIVCTTLLHAAGKGVRSNTMFVRAGLMKTPHEGMLYETRKYTGLPAGLLPAEMAETLLLSLENRCSNYSIGTEINIDKMEEIANLAVRHNFEVWVPEGPIR